METCNSSLRSVELVTQYVLHTTYMHNTAVHVCREPLDMLPTTETLECMLFICADYAPRASCSPAVLQLQSVGCSPAVLQSAAVCKSVHRPLPRMLGSYHIRMLAGRTWLFLSLAAAWMAGLTRATHDQFTCTCLYRHIRYPTPWSD